MPELHPVLVVLLAAAVVMTGVWWLQVRTTNAGYVDVAWAVLMAVAGIFYALVGDGAALPRLLVGVLSATWGFRLAVHLLVRVRHEPEDGRYRHLREHWHGDQRRFFGFFMAQAVLTAPFSVPVFVASRDPGEAFTPCTALAPATWLAATGGGSVPDPPVARSRGEPP